MAMHSLLRITAWVATRTGRLLTRIALLLLALCLAVSVGFTLYAVSLLPPLQPWHTERLHEEFNALRHGDLDFDGYLKLETRLFEELRGTMAAWKNRDEIWTYSRFNPASPMMRLVEGAPYNRSFRLQGPKPVGQALLVHGLSDSPYSMKAMAETLHASGFDVTVLRLPGHGTLPSMMTEMSLRDWTAAVRIAARDVAGRARGGQLFYVGGYSTGGALVLQYTLDALDDPALRLPDRVLLVAPAIELTPLAALANVIDLFSIIPVPVLEKVHWQEIGVEYDPYKFNSFPVNATRQINRATRQLRQSIKAAAESGAIARMPPVVTWQSVVDSTVGSTGVADVLYARLQGEAHRLVLFDVNRRAALAVVQRPSAGVLVERLSNGPRRYTLDFVTNTTPEGSLVSIHHLPPGGEESVRDTRLAWPENLVSLGHTALSFPADDPVYGMLPGSGRGGMPSIGSLLFRGESGAVTLSLGALTRPRSNPFWSLIAEDIADQVAADLQQRQSR